MNSSPPSTPNQLIGSEQPIGSGQQTHNTLPPYTGGGQPIGSGQQTPNQPIPPYTGGGQQTNTPIDSGDVENFVAAVLFRPRGSECMDNNIP